MKIFPSILSCLACLVLLGGCGTPNDFSAQHPQMVAAPDSVSAMLADAADRASAALEKLAAVEYSQAPTTNISPVGEAPPELRRAITVNWVGPVEPITKTLADRAGYHFMTVGNAPPVPIIVSVDVENRGVIDVLRDIGLQMGARADVRVDGQRRAVEIIYPDNTGLGQ